ncbi:PREDICTED: endonuclease domain-containing 1 protein-like, partial [Ficedula albicollis]|uniref:endonuclease domain-containing 1 protein-like n=1 Tax=Ficedula albicollis TaxID=59894 RepID=UPI0007AD930E
LTPFPLLPLVNKLVNIDFGKEMAEESSIKSGNIGQNQAIDEDYRDALMPVDRGHLCPSSHLYDQNSTWATFTLTNIVPQYRTLNQGAWSNYEGNTMRGNTQGCDTTYVITGAVPGNTNTTNGRVNIPSHIWSAACCVSKNEPIKAWGAIAENQIHNNEVTNLNLGRLEAKLSELYGGKDVTLFNNGCPRQ